MSNEQDSTGAARVPNDYPLGPDSLVQEGVPQGALTAHTWAGTIYPGTTHDYWVYAPAQYDPTRPACVMVFLDGASYIGPDGDARVPTVFDNLIHNGDMPVTVGIFIDAGVRTGPPEPVPDDFFEAYPLSQRADEYDVLGDRYARFLLEEILPAVGKTYNLAQTAEARAICGASSGGICSWTVAWERPDAFSKVISHIGSFADIRGGHVYPFLIRKAERKPIRVFLQAGENDLNCVWGDWALCNRQMDSALKFKEYDYKFVMGDGDHSRKHGGAILPDSLRWLWRDFGRSGCK
jgi:enterochelin esterase-like enzyme